MYRGRKKRKNRKNTWSPETCRQQMKALNNALQKERRLKAQGDDLDKALANMERQWTAGMVRAEMDEQD